MKEKKLTIETTPHIHSGNSVQKIMGHVILALLPICIFAVYSFGLSALLILLVSVSSCWLTENLLSKFLNDNQTSNDLSVIITGILLGLTFPPALPLWMVCLGGIFSVTVGKFLFGGLGFNPFNPALVGRAFLQAAFPNAMSNWSPAFSVDRFTSIPSSTFTFPFLTPEYDQLSSATPLAVYKFSNQLSNEMDLFLGLNNGSIGETSSLLILICGAYLIFRGMINWRIPAGIFGITILLSTSLPLLDLASAPNGFFMLFSGGLMLGAMFMATDPVASPITNLGCLIYGVLIGTLIFVIRIWGGMPEGVMYAILISNAVSPHIDAWIQPSPFGRKRV